MFINHFRKSVTVISLITSTLPAFANEQVVTNAPFIHPDRKCITEGMVNPEDKSYRYLYSKDCRTVYVLPPSNVQPSIKSRTLPSVHMCADMAAEYRILSQQVERQEVLSAQVRDLESKLDDDQLSSAQYEKIRARIDDRNKMLAEYNEKTSKYRAQLLKDYSGIPAVDLSILLDSSISQNELNQIRALNLANLYQTVRREKPGLDEKGNPITITEEILESSSLRPAPISDSTYSFSFYGADKGGAHYSVYSTNIPQLELLRKEGSDKAVAHVRGGDTISGEMTLSVHGVCKSLENPDGTYRSSFKDQDPLFTVNREFTVQQQYFEGYDAYLRIDKIVEQIVSESQTHSNQGFSKSGTFLDSINGNIDELIDFKWTNNYQTQDSAALLKVLEIKKEVAAKMIDDYMDNLTKAGIIKIKEPTALTPAQGGMVDEARTEHRCWTDRDGGISGALGRRHRVCGDFTYFVKVWRDGITKEEVTKQFNIDVKSEDHMSIGRMVPFFYGTTFQKKAE